MRKKLVPEEKAICNVVAVYRQRGNYLQRLELFEKAIQAYNEALRWNEADVRSLLGRSLARANATHYAGALADAAKAAELEPDNVSALQIRAQTNYEKCEFERALLLSHRGQRIRKLPPNFAACVRIAEETVRECIGKNAENTLSHARDLCIDLKKQTLDEFIPEVRLRMSRIHQMPTYKVREISRTERQKTEHISRLMASKYLERMAHDKYFLTSLCKDERLLSANKKGSAILQELAHKALSDVENRQAVLRERRPLYAARASEAAARARLSRSRKEQQSRAQKQHTIDAQRLLNAAQMALEEHDTSKCLEATEFALQQITRKPAHLLPMKEKYLQQLYDIVANTFLYQKCVKETMNESDREKRAFILLGMYVSREPSKDSVLKVRPPAPPRDIKQRLRILERTLTTSTRPPERCYLLHELARLHLESKQAQRARYFAMKCQTEARASEHRVWLLNATFLIASCHLLQNNRPEARAALIEAANTAQSYNYSAVAAFLNTCVNISLEGEVFGDEASLEKREKAMVSLMQDEDLRSAAEHLFKRMSLVPASRRFSVMPSARVGDSAPTNLNRRVSIIPKAQQQPTRVVRKKQLPLGFQEFDV
ncbi:hypothetical protein ACJJTC_013419 [Scirpophaga incertulas]